MGTPPLLATSRSIAAVIAVVAYRWLALNLSTTPYTCHMVIRDTNYELVAFNSVKTVMKLYYT